MEQRIGNQTPTQAVVLPYTKTLGDEAVELYNSTGNTAREWQERQIYDIMAYNDDGLWIHTKYGYEVPRRNGKGEIIAIRELYGLVKGEHIMHTAHLTSTSHAAWDRLYSLCEKAGLNITSSYRAYGKEHIEIDGNGKIEFRTRTAKGGLGEGYDLLIIDEAQEYQTDHEAALKYVVSDSANPQTILCGTPPTAVSSGTVFPKLRNTVLSGKSEDTGWAEWSVEFMTDPKDIESWYKTNPSLGFTPGLSERKIKAEITGDDVDFNIQRLGYWSKQNQKSAISEAEWNDLLCKSLPEFQQSLYIGIKYGLDGTNVALSVAVKTTNKQIFVECLDCQPVRNGPNWMIKYIKAMKPAKVVIDGASGQRLLAEELKARKVKGVILPTVQEVITANSLFEQGIFNQSIAHMNQPSVTQVIGNCDKRAIGSGGGFGYKPLKDGTEIAIMDSIILAHWTCSKSRERRKQKITY